MYSCRPFTFQTLPRIIGLMPRSSPLVENSMNSATDEESDGTFRPPVVSQKVRKNGKRGRIIIDNVDVIHHTRAPEVLDEVVRIVNECDPIGFLTDIVNGKAVQAYSVDKKGKVHEFYETPTLVQRVRAAMYLADKYLPNVSVIKYGKLHDKDDQKPTQEESQSFSRKVTHAASRFK